METARKMVYRGGEGTATWFRSNRIFGAGDQWYFHTREGVDLGPYESRFEAEIEAGMLRELLHSAESAQASLAVIRDFVLESYDMGRPLMPRYRLRPLALV